MSNVDDESFCSTCDEVNNCTLGYELYCVPIPKSGWIMAIILWNKYSIEVCLVTASTPGGSASLPSLRLPLLRLDILLFRRSPFRDSFPTVGTVSL